MIVHRLHQRASQSFIVRFEYQEWIVLLRGEDRKEIAPTNRFFDIRIAQVSQPKHIGIYPLSYCPCDLQTLPSLLISNFPRPTVFTTSQSSPGNPKMRVTLGYGLATSSGSLRRQTSFHQPSSCLLLHLCGAAEGERRPYFLVE